MLVLAYLIGLLGSTSLSFVVYLLNSRLDVQLHSFTLRFIIPIGGFFVGLVTANCIAWGKIFFQKKMLKIDILVALIFGLFSYLFIDYLSYYTMYINEGSNGEIDIVTSLTGKKGYDKLSDYITFIDYMDMINSSSSIQTRYRGAIKVGNPIEVGRTGTLILFFVQIIGVLVGAIVTMSRKRDETPYCDNCKKYNETKVLKKVNIENIEEGLLGKKLEELYEYSGTMTKLKGLINSFHDLDENSLHQGEMYLTITLVYCNNCLNGDLIIAFYIVKEDEHSLEKSFLIKLQGNISPLLDELWNSNQEYNQEKKLIKKNRINKKKI